MDTFFQIGLRGGWTGESDPPRLSAKVASLHPGPKAQPSANVVAQTTLGPSTFAFFSPRQEDGLVVCILALVSSDRRETG